MVNIMSCKARTDKSSAFACFGTKLINTYIICFTYNSCKGQYVRRTRTCDRSEQSHTGRLRPMSHGEGAVRGARKKIKDTQKSILYFCVYRTE